MVPSDLLAHLVEQVADAVADRVLSRMSKPADELVDRRQAGISLRLWKRLVASGQLATFRDGRRHVAKRADVLRAIESQRIEPKAGPVDSDEEALRRAGIRR